MQVLMRKPETCVSSTHLSFVKFEISTQLFAHFHSIQCHNEFRISINSSLLVCQHAGLTFCNDQQVFKCGFADGQSVLDSWIHGKIINFMTKKNQHL